MTEKNCRLSELADKFFNGTISYSEEKELFDILNKDDEQHAYFKQLEQDWTNRHIVSAETEQQWQRFRGIISMPNVKPVKKQTTFMRYKLAAAAVALIVVSSLTTILFGSIGSKEEIYYTCVAPSGGKAEVVLPDGSHVWLNAESKLVYSSSFNKGNRRVGLNGEGYFEITKEPNGEKFIVNTNGYDVVVHGTKFNVLAYTDDPVITTTLFEGSVCIDRSNESIMMVPGEKVTLDKSSGTLTKSKTSNKANAWVYNNTEYDSITLADLAKVLSRRFDVNISIESEKLRNERFAISLNNSEDLEGIMSGLKKIIPIKTVRKGRSIQIEYR